MTKLLLTGASGYLGRLTLDALIASGKTDPADIIAVTRDPNTLSGYAQKGVDVRAGDFNAPETLANAFAGADRVAIISVDLGDRIRRHGAAIAAAKAAGARHILYTSLPRIAGVPVTFGADHFETEALIAASGVAHTILRNGWYAENLFLSLPTALKAGQLFSSAGDGRVSYAPRQAYAEALAAALVNAGDENRIYTLTGTETFSDTEMVALANAVFGTSISVIGISDEQAADGLKQAGMPDFVVPVLVSMSTNIRNGGLDIVTGDIEALTGKIPQSLKDFLVANKDAFLAAAK